MVNPAQLDALLERFTVAKHGDRNERMLWPFVQADFPMYENLWRRYVVPQTHRLEPGLPFEQQIRLRPEMTAFEPFIMSHYSVFYYFGHARRRLSVRRSAENLTNDVFYLLDSSLDNTKAFFEELPEIGKLISANFGRLRNPKDDKDYRQLREIADYRDTLLHNPVLGRGIARGADMIPVHAELAKIKKSWLYAQALPAEKFVNARELLEAYCSRYGQYLNLRWKQIFETLEGKRSNFTSRLRLNDIGVTPIVSQESDRPSTHQPIAASGRFVLQVEARSDAVQFPSLLNDFSKTPRK